MQYVVCLFNPKTKYRRKVTLKVTMFGVIDRKGPAKESGIMGGASDMGKI